MAAGSAPAALNASGQASASKAWPSSKEAYWALSVIIFATFMTFFDQQAFGMLAERIKADFQLSDALLGFLAGPATIICYIFVGIPLARMADIYPRNIVLAVSATVVGVITTLSGFAQNFTQFVGTRVFLMAGGAAHAPASYSLIADAFPPKFLTRAFALLQIGFIGGMSLGGYFGGKYADWSAHWPITHFAGLELHSWQLLLIGLGVPSMVAGLLFMTVKEPQRLAPAPDTMQLQSGDSGVRKLLTIMGWDALKAINARPKVYYPLFAALALSAVETFGLLFWRTPFMIRSYGWTAGQVGSVMVLLTPIASTIGLVFGGIFVERLARKYKDANVRAAFICFVGVTVCNILSPIMPSGEISIAVIGVGVMFGIAGAVPQNAAIQRIAPNDMRGQITAFYLFMFTFFGAVGSWFVGQIQTTFIQVDKNLWMSLVITASTLLPLAAFLMYCAIKPYGQEVERLEAAEAKA